MAKIGVKLIRGLMKAFGSLPLSFHLRMAGFARWILKDVMGYRKDVIYVNLARSFPELKYPKLKEIANGYYSHMARIVTEAIWFGASSEKRVEESHICEVENPDEFASWYENSQKSLMVLYSHCGNWEILGGIKQYFYGKCPFNKDNFYIVYKRLHNKVWNDVFYQNRQNPVEGYKGQLESNEVLRFILKNKANKSVYMVNVDQSPYESAYPIGEFLHQDTKAMMAMANIAHKLSMPVIYMEMREEEPGKYKLHFTEICKDASIQTPEEIMRKYYDLLEEEVKNKPHNYLWSHKRWKF